MRDEEEGACRLSACLRRRAMKSNSPRRAERRDVDLRGEGESPPSAVFSSLIPHPHPLKMAAHRVEAGADDFGGGREGEAEVALAVFAEDDAGDGGDLRAFEERFGGGAAVGVD